MAKMGQFFKSNYFSADSLLEGDITLTISHCEPVVFESRDKTKNDEQKMVVFFHEDERGLALNVTNWNSISEITGDEDTDTWTNHRITLFRKKDKGFGGGLVWCVRVKEPNEAATATVPANRQQQRPKNRDVLQETQQERRTPQATEQQYPEVDDSDIPF